MKKIIYSAFILLLAIKIVPAHAQNTIFLSQGRVEFEKTENNWAKIDDIDWDAGDFKEQMKKNTPQFKKTYFDLRFNKGKTLFEPGREADSRGGGFFWNVAGDNVVFNNLDNEMSTSKKSVFEVTFLVQDSTRKIQWKITNETRNIAGFECRRANALIMDSIYVVAFYTDAITSTGGPESFTGLPGMILGVAIPHEHTTWFATKVFTETIPETTLVPPTKGKKVNNVALMSALDDMRKNWGKEGRQNIKQIML